MVVVYGSFPSLCSIHFRVVSMPLVLCSSSVLTHFTTDFKVHLAVISKTVSAQKRTIWIAWQCQKSFYSGVKKKRKEKKGKNKVYLLRSLSLRLELLSLSRLRLRLRRELLLLLRRSWLLERERLFLSKQENDERQTAEDFVLLDRHKS